MHVYQISMCVVPMVDAVIPRDAFSTTHTSSSDVSVTQAGMVTGASTKVRDFTVIIMAHST